MQTVPMSAHRCRELAESLQALDDEFGRLRQELIFAHGFRALSVHLAGEAGSNIAQLIGELKYQAAQIKRAPAEPTDCAKPFGKRRVHSDGGIVEVDVDPLASQGGRPGLS